MTHTITTLSQPTDIIIMFIAALVFSFSFGFTLWKALCYAQSAIYWQTVLCISLLGIGITFFSSISGNMWNDFLIAGTTLLTLTVLMTAGAIIHNTIRFYINNRVLLY